MKDNNKNKNKKKGCQKKDKSVKPKQSVKKTDLYL